MNIYKLSIAISAVLIVASCTKEININEPGTGNDITVRSKVTTKAGYTTQSLPSEFVMDIIQGETGYNYSNVIMYEDPSTGTYKAKSSQGNSIALKWVNSNHSEAQIKAMTIPSGVATTLEEYLVRINIEENQTTEANFKKNDILGAGIGAERKGVTVEADDIILDFSHLMSKLHVVYETENKGQTVQSITLKNVCTEGYYSYKDMTGGSPTTARGDIEMFLNPSVKYGTKAAEAIFYPFTVGSANELQLVVTLSESQKELKYNIPVKKDFSFSEGKRYLLNIKIKEDGSIIANGDVSSDYNWVKNVPGGRILWIGTSIPAGGGTVFSYPQMISNATGLEIVNNSVGGSKVLRVPTTSMPSLGYVPLAWVTIDWTTYPANGWNHLMAGGLAQTKKEADDTYRAKLMEVSGNNTTWTNQQIAAIQALSYESLIIPYIDGSIDNCQTIVIDHGFNDLIGVGGLHGLSWESGGFRTEAELNSGIWGDAFFQNLNKSNYKDAYVNPVLSNETLTEEGSYLLSMERIINAIYDVNPNVKIIIGNYFAPDSPWVRNNMYATFPNNNFTGTLCRYNEAVANVWELDIVNVYKFIGSIGNWDTFCPDGVHPSSETTGNSNRRITDIYLQEFAKIFGTTTKSASDQSYAVPDWEDVELL